MSSDKPKDAGAAVKFGILRRLLAAADVWPSVAAANVFGMPAITVRDR
jgi:hypothetical protein